jgi:hypothetical protein
VVPARVLVLSVALGGGSLVNLAVVDNANVRLKGVLERVARQRLLVQSCLNNL